MTATLFPSLVVPRSDKETYRRRAQAIILRKGLRGEEVTADDVHALLPCPENVNPKNLGIAFHDLDKAGVIAPVRYATSTRPCRHNGLYRTWRVVDGKIARALLRALASTGDAAAAK